jgi:hypothetical protein
MKLNGHLLHSSLSCTHIGDIVAEKGKKYIERRKF